MSVIEQTESQVIVRFSPTEVASVGLPKQGAYVSYRVKGGCLLEDYSAWLGRGDIPARRVDKLIALADKTIDKPRSTTP